ncbi:hypothetical protein [Allomuricauda sp. d1]|uniref:hypothetical protein n=1 Tax=Allomuricauda sp. d1 TaxID=3136725 RepID=UPI0031E361D0
MAKNNTSKKLARKRIFIESFVALLIIVSPFIYKSHEYLPENSSVETVKFLWFEIGKSGFPSIEMSGWFFVSKVVPLYLLLIWFLTCKHWWYHIILIPLLMFTFQLFEGYYLESGTIDSENILWLLPVCMVVIPFVYFIRVKLYDKHVHGIDLKAMDTELSILKEKEELRKEREKLEQLKDKTPKASELHSDNFKAHKEVL